VKDKEYVPAAHNEPPGFRPGWVMQRGDFVWVEPDNTILVNSFVKILYASNIINNEKF
jgi:hypothetical protein